MEYFNRSKICREFLNQYSDTLFPELLPKLMKVAIYALHKTFHKWNFSMQELDQFINFFNYKNRNFELESNCQDKPPCPPCEEYLIPKTNKIQKLNMGFRPPEGQSNSDTENGAIDCYGYGKFYPNDEVYVNEKNNFYDENYYVPRNHSYRNIQLYHKRLKNPKFITQEKRIYPHWWWNLKDDIEQDDYSEDDSDIDHYPNRRGRFPKEIEDKLKKKAKRFVRNKSFSGTRPVMTGYYDEKRIFPNANITTNNDDFNYSFYPRREHSPTDEISPRPFSGTSSDGNRRVIPNSVNNDNIKRDTYDIANSINLSTSPLYTTSPNFYNRPPLNGGITEMSRSGIGGIGPGLGSSMPGLGSIMPGIGSNPPGIGGMSQGQGTTGIPPNGTIGIGQLISNPNLTQSGIGTVGLSSNITGTSALKDKLKNKRKIKESSVFSYDKDFNVSSAMIKKKVKEKKGIKYSLFGNELKEDPRGIIRRKK